MSLHVFRREVHQREPSREMRSISAAGTRVDLPNRTSLRWPLRARLRTWRGETASAAPAARTLSNAVDGNSSSFVVVLMQLGGLQPFRCVASAGNGREIMGFGAVMQATKPLRFTALRAMFQLLREVRDPTSPSDLFATR